MSTSDDSWIFSSHLKNITKVVDFLRNWGNLESYFILTFLATNFNLVAKKKKVFGLSRENRIAVRRPTFNPALARLLLYLLSSPSSTSLFQPFCRPLFWLLASKLFPLLFPRFSTFWPSQESKEFRERRKKEFEITGVESEFVRILQRVSALHCKIHCF